jgi:hypothetical protein
VAGVTRGLRHGVVEGAKGVDEATHRLVEQSLQACSPLANLVAGRLSGQLIEARVGEGVVGDTKTIVDRAKFINAQPPDRVTLVMPAQLALTRMQAWKVDPLEPGAEVGVLGFTFKDEKGDAVLRAEYLFVGGRVYGLRSSPA